MKCPLCGRIKAVHPSGDRNYYCSHCRITFDPTDDGDFSDTNPAARLERAERRAESGRHHRRFTRRG